MKNITNVETKGTYDVVVCGGGVAGVAAALAAARQGKKTLLIEKQFMLGGLATAGLITIYLPLCDGYGRQVSFGIAEELLRLSIKHGAEDMYPANWLEGIGTKTEKDKRFQVQFNAQLFAILMEQALVEAGAEILYGSYISAVEKNDDKIARIIVENKSGTTAYAVKSVVDATGDCDIAYMAGVPTDTSEEGNNLAAWYYFADNEGYHLKMQGCVDVQEEDLQNHNMPTLMANNRFTGLDGKELSSFTVLAHKKILENFLKRREENPSAWIATIPTTPQIRMTRKIIGEYVLAEEEKHTYFEDSIGMIPNWKRRGPVYEVPFRTLYSKQVKNLITAGRCVSTTEAMWELMRVIPCCAVMGEAAGIAATMTDDFTTLDVSALQEELKKNGVVLHEKDL